MCSVQHVKKVDFFFSDLLPSPHREIFPIKKKNVTFYYSIPFVLQEEKLSEKLIVLVIHVLR